MVRLFSEGEHNLQSCSKTMPVYPDLNWFCNTENEGLKWLTKDFQLQKMHNHECSLNFTLNCLFIKQKQKKPRCNL